MLSGTTWIALFFMVKLFDNGIIYKIIEKELGKMLEII